MRKSRLLLSLMLIPVQVVCMHVASASDPVLSSLPNLPAAALPGRIELDRSKVGLGYREHDEQWDARVEHLQSATPAFSLGYGRLLNNTVGLGARANYKGDQAETMVSSVMAPDRSVRLQISAGELRDLSACGVATPCTTSSRAQNGYSFSAKKILDRNSLLTGVAVDVFGVANNGAGMSAGGSSDSESDRMLERMRGHALNLTLRPLPQSTVDLRGGRGEMTYYTASGQVSREEVTAASIGYTQRFDDCLRFEGRYGAAANTDRLRLGLAQRRWNISVSRSSNADERDVSVQAGYTIPLGSAGRSRIAGCQDDATAFASLVESSLKQPRLIPRTPLSAMGDSDLADQLRGW